MSELDLAPVIDMFGSREDRDAARQQYLRERVAELAIRIATLESEKRFLESKIT